ncbi:MAG TPA: MFS transporter [Acidimicrobiia bacterium]
MSPRNRDAPYFATFAAMGVTQLVLGPSIATLRHTTGTSNGTIGVLFTVSATGYLAGIALSGQWLARRQVHTALRFGLLAMAAGLVLVPFAGSLGSLVAIEALIGFGTGWVEIPGNSAILWKHGGGSALNGLHASFSIGAVAAPILIYRSLAWTNGLHAGYIVAAAIPVVAVLLLATTQSPANPHVAVGRGVPRGARARTALGFVYFFAYVGVELAFAGWIYTYATLRGFDRAQGIYLGAAFLGAFAVGRVLSVRLARYLDSVTTLAIDHAVALTALLLLLAGRSAPVAVWTGTIVFGLGIASLFPAMMSLSESMVPATGTITSLYLAGSAIGTMAIPGSMGALLDRFGAPALPLTALIGLGVTACVAIAFTPRDRSSRRRAVPVSS